MENIGKLSVISFNTKQSVLALKELTLDETINFTDWLILDEYK